MTDVTHDVNTTAVRNTAAQEETFTEVAIVALVLQKTTATTDLALMDAHDVMQQIESPKAPESDLTEK